MAVFSTTLAALVGPKGRRPLSPHQASEHFSLLCVSFLCLGRAHLLCFVPILMDDSRWEPPILETKPSWRQEEAGRKFGQTYKTFSLFLCKVK